MAFEGAGSVADRNPDNEALPTVEEVDDGGRRVPVHIVQ
jgi:hypothetical protein